MAPHVSPLAPASFPELPIIAGVRLGVGETGMRYVGRPDVLLAVADQGSTIAGVFTRSQSRSAPVDWCVRNLNKGSVRAILVNAGNANAFTGCGGLLGVKSLAGEVARTVGCRQGEVFIASTGVIGEPLDTAPILSTLPKLHESASPNAWEKAARAIMTTDTFAKACTARTSLDGVTVTINGIAKGSGMIAPDMATLLVFLFTDAAIPAPVLQRLLTKAVEESFNCITVDSDTSTSDTVLMVATGVKAPPLARLRSASDPRLKPFAVALNRVCLELAHQVVKDGEGAEKFITVEVEGAASDRAARRIGFAIANSPLVKTAIAGEDANWGRIVMAVGKADAKADRDQLKIWIGGVRVASNGQRDPRYVESSIMPHMKGRNIDIRVDVGVGRGKATVWTCDFTHRYIDINGSYRS
jgi:glutamate N-acetyltransferase/amino-acid N-acetyltransferase